MLTTETGVVGLLIRGSDELNRMKNGIKTIETILSGVLRLQDFFTPSVISGEKKWPTFTCEGGFWKLIFGNGDWRLEFWKTVSPGGSTLLFSASGPFHVSDVKTVYSRLDDLIEALRKKIPGFDQRIWPYVQAAPLLPTIL
jgi:hypothetical protein